MEDEEAPEERVTMVASIEEESCTCSNPSCLSTGTLRRDDLGFCIQSPPSGWFILLSGNGYMLFCSDACVLQAVAAVAEDDPGLLGNVFGDHEP